jgi:hypothetical protein
MIVEAMGVDIFYRNPGSRDEEKKDECHVTLFIL